MNLHKLILTENACYKAGKTIVPKGIMVHSTGTNNPNLCRYVGPDDGLLGVNKYNNHWNRDRPDGKKVCVHAFIGKLADGSIATYQTLPWNHRGWHCGRTAGHDRYVAFEICEDDLADAEYFNAIYNEAIDLCVYLCRMFNLDPAKDGVLICHCEGYKRGIASNHGDVMNWFPKHGKSMDTFRADVKAALDAENAPAAGGGGGTVPEPKPVARMAVGSKVTLKSSAGVYTNGVSIPASVKDKTYTIQQVKEDRVLLKEIVSWVYVKDLEATSFVPTNRGDSRPAAIKVGSKVKIVGNTYTNGVKVPGSVKAGTYTVQQLKADWALLKEIYSWVELKDLKAI